MTDWTNHAFVASWDAPVDQVRVDFAFRPGCAPTGPSFAEPGDPGWPDEVEVRRVLVQHRGDLREVPWLAAWAEEQFAEDMAELARAERLEMRAEARAGEREAA